jgi:hypothetical protein
LKITFGIIVLNGEPFTKYCLRSLYPFAHEIIVVEGGHPGAHSVTTPDGHSIDGTLESLKRFKEEEDPKNKVQIITRGGFWPQKDEMGHDRTPQCRAYAERATGDYLWQVDIDEFYRPEDMEKVIRILSNDPSITTVSFNTHTFWARPEYKVDCWELRRGAGEYHRLFKWGPGYQYITHEPPTVLDETGRDLRLLNWIRGKDLAKTSVFMYHYSLLFPWQVKQKTLIYKDEKPELCSKICDWAENNYNRIDHPYRVHNLYHSPSWLDRFDGQHPPKLVELMADIKTGKIEPEMRPTGDVEKLLSTWWYPLGRNILKIANHVDWQMIQIRKRARRIKRAVKSSISRSQFYKK